MSKEVIKLITERKMSDAKDMIDSILKSKLAESIDMFYEKNLDLCHVRQGVQVEHEVVDRD